MINLTGCISFYENPELNTNKNIEIIEWQKYKDGCQKQTKQCPAFVFKGAIFEDEPVLNEIIERHLLFLVDENTTKENSLWNYQNDYLKTAQSGDNLVLTATVLMQNKVLVVLELTVEQTFASGIYNPTRALYINFDKVKQREVELSNILLPNKQEAFDTVVNTTYKQWLEVNQLLNNEIFQMDWPFVKTDNIALLEEFLVLKYQPNTLAPHAMGFPELLIPYTQLQSIIRPEYIPQ